MRPDDEPLTEMEKKNIRKMFINELKKFPDEEEEEDSKAAKLAAS